MAPITEQDLVLPALYCIHNAPDSTLTTTELIGQLRELLQPEGEDLEPLKDRSDDKFSQKVRNLRSHKTLERLELCTYDDVTHVWRLTEKGHVYLASQASLLDYVLNSGFKQADVSTTLARFTPDEQGKPRRTPIYFDERVTITEGTATASLRKVTQRSARLRQAAIDYYSQNGRIVCAACAFDFEQVYGAHGAGFIEIHHQVPIVAYTEDDVERTLDEAIANVVPLCANCHRMIHRDRNHMLTVDELRAIIAQQQHKPHDT